MDTKARRRRYINISGTRKIARAIANPVVNTIRLRKISVADYHCSRGGGGAMHGHAARSLISRKDLRGEPFRVLDSLHARARRFESDGYRR